MIRQIFNSNHYSSFAAKALSTRATSANSQTLQGGATRQVQTTSEIFPPARPEALGLATASDFTQSIKAILTPDAQGNIHEEELQYAVVVYLLDNIVPEATALYNEVVAAVIGQGEPPLTAEDAVKIALQEVVGAGLLNVEEAEMINGVSFLAAQLDQDRSTLYDNRGSENDPTIAVMSIDKAIAQADSVLSALESSTIPLPTRPLDAPSNRGTRVNLRSSYSRVSSFFLP